MSTTIDEAVRQIMAARPVFKPGDIVRIRVNPECDYCLRIPNKDGSGWHEGDGMLNDGRTATVINVSHPHDCSIWNCAAEPDGGHAHHAHCIDVKFHEPMPHDEPIHESIADIIDWDLPFAPEELELLGLVRR